MALDAKRVLCDVGGEGDLMMVSKLEVRHFYINNLVEMYEGRVNYSSGSPAREAAIRAADAALAGHIKLEGAAWFKALEKAGLKHSATKSQIAALPENPS